MDSTPAPGLQPALRILVVCQENRCRSPLAECAMRHDWSGRAFTVHSAGLDAADGALAHALARLAALEAGLLEIEAHRSRRLTIAAMQSADLVLVMEERQRRAVLARLPSFTGRVLRLGHWQNIDIVDPVEADAPSASPCLAQIRDCLGDWRRHLEGAGLLPASQRAMEGMPNGRRLAN